ncbi:MAG: hypothetical protein ABIZ05_07865 [Pseudonocardiaceae bacterium]
MAKVHAIDPDQAWFWTPEWQAKEREINEKELPVSQLGILILARIFSPIWKPSSKTHLSCEPNVRTGVGVRQRLCETHGRAAVALSHGGRGHGS